jgi:hypothetical protein
MASTKIRTPEEAGKSVFSLCSRETLVLSAPPRRPPSLLHVKVLANGNCFGIVARIAYLASDVIVSVQPAQAIDSEFSSHLHRYAGRRDRGLVAATEDGVPEVGCRASAGVQAINILSRFRSSDTMMSLSYQFSHQFAMAGLFPSPQALPSSSPLCPTFTD